MTTRRKARRGLAVLADGSQAAFAAGAVAELARAGQSWTVARGAGLGAQVAVLALLGEAGEAERRWRRQAESGLPLFTSAVSGARSRLGERPGIAVTPDAWSLSGWLDPDELREHLAPEAAGVPERLRRAGVRCTVAVEDLSAGTVTWVELSELSPAPAAEALAAAASFPAGWPAVAAADGAAAALRWGGVGLVASGAGWLSEAAGWDVVCGFPVPPVSRPGIGDSLLELVQRREEIRAGSAAAGWGSPMVRLVAPTTAGYARWAGRGAAELGVEYPLPWERNAELVGLLVDFGRAAASKAVPSPVGPNPAAR
jgi:hypothetical protein